jgi:hypothetical protein
MDAIARGKQRIRQFLERERDVPALACRLRRLRVYTPGDRDRLRHDLLNDELDEIYSGHGPEEEANG